MNFGEKVRFLRNKRGLTQAQLAIKANTTITTISAIENGNSVPGYMIVGNLADVLGCEKIELLELAAENKREVK